jgi:hypothetical protein
MTMTEDSQRFRAFKSNQVNQQDRTGVKNIFLTVLKLYS